MLRELPFIPPRTEAVSQCHSEALAEESRLHNLLVNQILHPAREGFRMTKSGVFTIVTQPTAGRDTANYTRQYSVPLCGAELPV